MNTMSTSADVTIYTALHCKGSKKALEKLQKKGINFHVINVSTNSGKFVSFSLVNNNSEGKSPCF